MTWDVIQQVIRIGMYAVGSALLGQDIADGASYQAAIGGLIDAGAFIWWFYHNKETIKSASAE
ncbi:hypothetical protein [uncultured Cohaesibacter sp.]|uniref:hypothetical protein n=1 Tax=uncultured Cohaesibacter sp. TaxID=1002546 RepID=UPI00292ED0EB|nr:hypothetical protein [uncultured Cohaesibacter sp.]